MLPLESTNGKKKIEIIFIQRRIILVLLTILTIIIFAFFVNIAFNIFKQKQADDILVSAKNQANQILSDAENDASTIRYNANVDANQKATEITASAQTEAETIKKTAEDKANTIVDKAINTQIGEIETLLAITEAEAGDQPVKGRAAVASIIKNRIKDKKEFKANTITEVVYAPRQFDPVTNGTFSTEITPSSKTIEGVKLCLEGNDYSNGALYFFDPKISTKNNVKWFNTLQTTTIIGDHVFKR